MSTFLTRIHEYQAVFQIQSYTATDRHDANFHAGTGMIAVILK